VQERDLAWRARGHERINGSSKPARFGKRFRPAAGLDVEKSGFLLTFPVCVVW
jgi:hypothetical protein